MMELIVRDNVMHRMGPLKDVASTEPCAACHAPFVVGDYMTLIALGPGDDSEARGRAVAGRAYNAVTIALHWACATGEET